MLSPFNLDNFDFGLSKVYLEKNSFEQFTD